MLILDWLRRRRQEPEAPPTAPPRVFEAPVYAVYGRPLVRPVLRAISFHSFNDALAQAHIQDAASWGALRLEAIQEYGVVVPAGTVVPDELDVPEEQEWREREAP